MKKKVAYGEKKNKFKVENMQLCVLIETPETIGKKQYSRIDRARTWWQGPTGSSSFPGALQ